MNAGVTERTSPLCAFVGAWQTVQMLEGSVGRLADTRVLGALLEELNASHNGYELLEHWQQGEFHHDVVLRIATARSDLAGAILVVATNCNGGVKEVIAFESVPARRALWHWRCPQVADFFGGLPPILERAVTEHYFDPCELLTETARSELRPECRQRQEGGGWEQATSAAGCEVRRDS